MSNYEQRVDDSLIRKPKMAQISAFATLFIAINLYSLLVPIRLFFSNTFYIALEMIILSVMMFILLVNILKRPGLLFKYSTEFFIVFSILFVSLLGTLIMRSGAESSVILRYLRLLYSPLIASLLVLSSNIQNTTLIKKKVLIYIPVISLIVAVISSLTQLIRPDILASLFRNHPDYINMARSTNFVRGSVHNRIIGIFNDPNLFGTFLVLNILLILLFFYRKKQGHNSLKLIIPLVLIVFFTTSRTALFTLAMCFIVYGITSINLKRISPLKSIAKIFIGVISLLVIIGGIFVVFNIFDMSWGDLIRTRFFQNSFDEFRTFNNRTTSWMSYLQIFSDNPWTFIFGVDSYNLRYYSYGSIENALIGVPMKYGIIIFVLLVLYIWSLLSRGQLNRVERYVILAFLLMTAISVDIDTLQHITVPIFVYLSIGNISKQKQEGWK